jgi:hypothetical protein
MVQNTFEHYKYKSFTDGEVAVYCGMPLPSGVLSLDQLLLELCEGIFQRVPRSLVVR